jgi:hypothetical protein
MFPEGGRSKGNIYNQGSTEHTAFPRLRKTNYFISNQVSKRNKKIFVWFNLYLLMLKETVCFVDLWFWVSRGKDNGNSTVDALVNKVDVSSYYVTIK